MRQIWLFLLFSAVTAAQVQKLPMAVLKDKIEGGWAGQMIGVSYGAPTEFRYRERIIPTAELPVWTPDKVNNSLVQDDLYVDMTFAKVLDDKGLDATTDDFGAMFKNAKYKLWHANLSSRRALKRGVPASKAGTPEYNTHADDIDFQIEADFIGLMAPGLYQSATDIAWRAGRVMNYGDGIYGGIFVSCMYSAGFFEKDPRKVVDIGLACLPKQSRYAQMIGDVVAWSKAEKDWTKVWQKLEDKWNNQELCPEGAMRPFNIDAALNGAYIALGLLYGGGDFGKTIEISTRAGQDSDCNPASAAGILGVMVGYKAIPASWKGGIAAIADKKFDYTDFTFKTIVESTVKRSVALVKKTGGQLEGDTLMVKTEAVKPARLETWVKKGQARERVAVSDARWKFTGAWKTMDGRGKVSSEKGATAEIAFEGNGFIVAGPLFGTGGQADAYLDGKLVKTVDSYPDEDSNKGTDALFHAFGLKDGKHSVKIVVRGERMFDSKGADVAIVDLVVMR